MFDLIPGLAQALEETSARPTKSQIACWGLVHGLATARGVLSALVLEKVAWRTSSPCSRSSFANPPGNSAAKHPVHLPGD